MAEQTEVKAPRRRTLKGHVVSDKMAKTVLVAVSRKKRHPLFDKVVASTKKYMADDPRGKAGVGDFVLIEESRPLSKRKCWRLLKVLEKAR